MKLLAANGGVVMINFLPTYVSDELFRWGADESAEKARINGLEHSGGLYLGQPEQAAAAMAEIASALNPSEGTIPTPLQIQEHFITAHRIRGAAALYGYGGVAELSERYDVPVHIHVAETAGEVDDCVREHGVRPVAYLDSLGLVNERSVFAHGVHLDDAELALIAARGATLVTCPVSNMKLAVGGAFRYPAAHAAGCAIGIGTDGAASNNSLDLIQDVKVLALLQKHTAQDPAALPAPDASRRLAAKPFDQRANVGRPHAIRDVEVRELRLRHRALEGRPERSARPVSRGVAGAAPVGFDRAAAGLEGGAVQHLAEPQHLVEHFLGASVLPVDLVDDDDGRQVAGQRLLQHVTGLRQRTFGGIDEQEHTVDHGQGALDLAAEVGVAGGVDEVDLDTLPVDGSRLGEDGDATLALLVVGVHDAVDHRLVGREGTRGAQERVDEGGLSVVDVRNQRDVTDL